MLRNYFTLSVLYKRITSAKRIEIGDWVVVKKRSWLAHKGIFQTTIYCGCVAGKCRKTTIIIRVLDEDTFISKGGVIEKAKSSGREDSNISEDLQCKGTAVFAWNSKHPTHVSATRPAINSRTLHYIDDNL